MAEDKNKTDSDRIKELLAQLRATMDLEEKCAADPEEAEAEVKEENARDGYEATLQELLSADATPDEEEEREACAAEDAQKELSVGDEDGTDEEAVDAGSASGDTADDDAEAAEGRETKPSFTPVAKNKKEMDVAAALASFVITDEEEEDEAEQSFYDLLRELEEEVSAENEEADTPASCTEEDENGTAEGSEDGAEDTEIFYTESDADDASFDDKTRLSASTTFAIPTAEEGEEEEDSVVSVGEFSSVTHKEDSVEIASEDENADGETFLGSRYSVAEETEEFTFGQSVSLPFWEREEDQTPAEGEAEENTDGTADEEVADASSEERAEEDLHACEAATETLVAEEDAEAIGSEAEETDAEADETDNATVSAVEIADETVAVRESEEASHTDDAVQNVSADEGLPNGILEKELNLDGERAEEDGLTVVGEALPADDGGSPPDDWTALSDVGNTADPLPYHSMTEAQGMVFERVASDGNEKEPIPTLLPAEDVTASCDNNGESEATPTTDGAEASLAVEAVETEDSAQEATEENGRRSPRIQLAPLAYRASREEEKEQEKPKEEEEESEDFLSGIPNVMRQLLEDCKPFGRVNRVQNITAEQKNGETAEQRGKSDPSQKKKRKKLFFAEEEEQEYCDTADADMIRERLQNDLRNTRARFVVISVFALLLLVLENYAFVPFFSGHSLLTAEKMGYAETFLLFGVAIAAAPCLRMGFCGLLYRRILPETVLLAQWLLSFVYALIFSIGELEVPHFSFACALGLGVCLFFRMIERENRIVCFRHLTTAGDKLILSPMDRKGMKAEMNALGRSEEDGPLNMYRIRKTSFVDEFSDRTSAICEDSIINFVMLVLFLTAQIASFVVCYVLTRDVIRALSACAFTLAFVPPMMMCAAHVYPMSRALLAAGEDSTILGEDTVNEAVSLDAIAFEDIEALPMKETKMTHMSMSDNPTFVLSCLNAIFRTVGGPLAGHFSAADQTKGTTKRRVTLVEAVAGGLSATVDGTVFYVGCGEYMAQKNVPVSPDAADAGMEKNERALYVAMGGRACAKFHIAYHLSPHFVENVKRLARLGITTLVRTYDPCLSDELLLAASASASDPTPKLEKGQIHAVNKTVGQRADFAAMHAPGGIVTSGHSGKLLQLLFLCFGTRRAVTVGRVSKLVLTALGAVGAVAMTTLGWFDVIPSALVALYHILWLSLSIVYVKCHIGIPKTTEGNKNESSKNIRHSKGRH